MKYDVSIITNWLSYDNTVRFNIGDPMNEDNTKELANKIADGYEIYSAIALCNDHSMGIRYVLRKERKL